MARIEVDGHGTYECAGDDTVLRGALRNGFGFPYGCNTGSCGNCRFTLLDGAVEHLRDDPPAWTDADRRRARWLGCQARPLGDCRVKVRLDPEAVPVCRPARKRALLTEIVPITHDMSEFAFALDGPDGFVAGQYGLLYLDGLDAPRAYSMSNLAGSGEWRFLIKHVPGGAASAMLFGLLRPGDAITIDGPYGLAYLREDRPSDLVLVAGGSGVSPMISIARAATISPGLADRRIHFFHGGRQERDMCAGSMLAELPGFGRRLTYVAAVSEASPGWTGPSGFIHEVVRENLANRLAELEVYFAGPPPMTRAMQAMLHEAGVTPDRMHFDEFF